MNKTRILLYTVLLLHAAFFISENVYSQTVKVLESNDAGMKISFQFYKIILETRLKDFAESDNIFNFRPYLESKQFAVPPGKKAIVASVKKNSETASLSPDVRAKLLSLSPNEYSNIEDIRLKGNGDIRGVRVYAVEVRPVTVNLSAMSVTYMNSLEVTINFVNDSELIGQESGIRNEDSSARFFADLLNKDKIPGWQEKAASLPSQRALFSSQAQTSWFEAGRTYYKLIVDNEGLYSLDTQYLNTIGLDVAGVIPSKIQIINKGIEIPIWVSGADDGSFDAQDRIIFYGDFNRGTTDYFDLYSDNNVYWLTLSDQDGLRLGTTEASPKSGTIDSTFEHTEHLERDLFYHHGLDFDSTTVTDFVDGERWIWITASTAGTENVSPPLEFDLYGIASSQELITYRFSVKGITEESALTTESHHNQFFVNDSLVLDVAWTGTHDTVFTVSSTANYLKPGLDTLIVKSLETSPPRDDRIYIDWFKADYLRKLRAVKDKLIYSVNLAKDNTVAIKNFTSDSIITYDVGNQRILANTVVSENGGTNELKFHLAGENIAKFVSVGISNLAQPIFEKEVFLGNLRNTANSADYIIITHEDFIEYANRYRAYRLEDTDRFQNGIMIVTVAEVYDQFNFGIKSPHAIKEFLTVTRNWENMPKYLLLLGDASWDPKKNSLETVNIDYVPSFGNPVSDTWFTFTGGTDDILPDLYVGRIPITNGIEFENYFEKLQFYESNPVENPAVVGEWMKRLLFLNGGVNHGEQATILTTGTQIALNNIHNHPFRGDTLFFNKKSTLNIDFSFKDDIIKAINRGVLWVNSMGHAAKLQYDIDFGTVDDLSNKDKYPFMVSMSCNTGRFANPFEPSLAEQYLFGKERGAIGYFGTTGWGELFHDNHIIEHLFLDVFRGNTLLSAAINDAKIKVYGTFGQTFEQINLVEQYSLLGSPALKLKILDKPEYTVAKGNIKLESSNPTVNDSPLDVKVLVDNYGHSERDSLSVELYDITNQVMPEKIGETQKLYRNGYLDSLIFKWDVLNKGGERELQVVLNSDNAIDELLTTNNTQNREVVIFNNAVAPYAPQNLTSVSGDLAQLTARVPRERSGVPATLLFEADTTLDFLIPIYQSPSVPEGDFFTSADFELPISVSDNQNVFWRVRTTEIDTLENWITSAFFVDSTADDKKQIWKQQKDTFNFGTRDKTGVSDSGLLLVKQPILIRAESKGFRDGNIHAIVVDGEEPEVNYFDPDLAENFPQGIYVTQVDEITGRIIDAAHFNTHLSEDHADGLVAYIDTIKSGRYVIAAIEDEGISQLHEAARNALKEIGSEFIDNVEFRDSWAIIGIKGATPGTVTESWVPTGEGGVSIIDSLLIQPVSGTFTSPAITGVSKWEELTFQTQMNNPGQQIFLSISGQNKATNNWDMIFPEDVYTSPIDLRTINADTYPHLRLSAKFTNPQQSDSQFLEYWSVSYIPSTDLFTNVNVLSLSADTVLQGRNLGLQFSLRRLPPFDEDSLTVNISLSPRGSGANTLLKEISLTFDDTASIITHIDTVVTDAITGLIDVIVELDPDNLINEVSEENNFAIASYFVEKDNIAPTIELLVDNKVVVDGDFISQSPQLKYIVTENTPSKVQDPGKITFYKNGNVNDSLTIVSSILGDTASVTTITHDAKLDSVENTFQLMVTDNFGNEITSDEITLFAEHQVDIREFYPLPNPFAEKTYFTYNLTQSFDDIEIKIFTIRGRLIRNIRFAPVDAGFNRIEWDGRDEDGDKIANGVYFCRIIGRLGTSEVVRQTKVAVIK